MYFLFRDRPFHLKGGGGGLWFFVSFRIFFRTTQELENLICLSRNFFPGCNIRLYDKNSESDYFFFLHQNRKIFFSNIGNQNIFLEKNITPPPPPPPPFKLNGRSLTGNVKITLLYTTYM